LDASNYPEVAEYSWDEIYGGGDNMAPGGLYLAAVMARSMNLKKGDIVLDIGCGRGESSIFLAEHFGVKVVSLDPWVSSTYLSRKFQRRGLRGTVFPVDLDASQPLPFPDDYFDALFCMQALHSFGTTADALRSLLRHLKPGGRFVVGGTCFKEEPPDGQLPEIFSHTDGWNAEYENYHSPSWWKAVFEETRLVNVVGCNELEEGLIMWEDDVIYHGERAGWTDDWYSKSKWLIDQLIYSRDHRPYLTHYTATVQKKDWSRSSRRIKTGASQPTPRAGLP
jgi:SAM-dependent methyltransferase